MDNELKPTMLIPVENILENPQNEQYFADCTKDEYQLIKQSIIESGIRDPVKVRKTGDKFILLAGHTRLRIAKELGNTYIKAVIYDGITDEEAEYLLVADNEERRHNDDPIKKAKRDKIILEYFTKKRKSGEDTSFNSDKIAAVAGYSNKSELYRSVKLNNLIPELQEMVSSGRLTPSAADPLARMSQENQRELYTQLGEAALEGLKLQEVRELKNELETEKRIAKEAQDRAVKLQAEVERLKKDNTEGHKLMKRVVDENAKLQEKLKNISTADISNLDPGDPRVKEYNELLRKIEVNKKLLDDLDKQKIDRETQIQKAGFELEDIKHNMKKLQEKTAKEDKAIMTIRKKLGEPLRSAFGEIKFLLDEVDDDPYDNLVKCINKHLPLLEETMELLKVKRETLLKAKQQMEINTPKAS